MKISKIDQERERRVSINSVDLSELDIEAQDLSRQHVVGVDRHGLLVHSHHLGGEAVAELHKVVHLDALGGPVFEEREQSEGV